MAVLLSIKPEYAEAILSGEKKFEFRRVIPKKIDETDRIYLYSNDSIKKIVGYFEVEEILENSPEVIWNRCKEDAGISREGFFEYFEGTEKAYAIEIQNPVKFPEPIDPYEKIQDFTPPQSFQYITDTEIFSKRLTKY